MRQDEYRVAYPILLDSKGIKALDAVRVGRSAWKYRRVQRTMTRLTLVLALVLGIAGTAAAAPVAVARTASGPFSVQPNIADSRCGNGHGREFPTHGPKEAAFASGTMNDGSTVTAYGQIYPGRNSVLLDAVTKRCQPDRRFGTDGRATIRIPSGLVPKHGSASYLWITAITARRGGGAIIGGTYRQEWVIGAITPSGRLDRSFGHDGWTALPWRGEVSAVLDEPNGRILLGGDNGGGGCCTINHAAALNSHGRLIHSFGGNGRVVLPTGEDAGVESLMREPNGNILAEVAYGNMGCWGVDLDVLTPGGKPVAGFARRQHAFWSGRGFGAFVGDAYPDRDNGFTLVGTGQQNCFDTQPGTSDPTATGILATFTPNGGVMSSTTYPSRMYGGVDAFKDGSNTLLVESSYTNATRYTLRLLKPNGANLAGFGASGKVRIRTPWSGSSAGLDTEVHVTKSGPNALTVVATREEHRQWAVIRLRY